MSFFAIDNPIFLMTHLLLGLGCSTGRLDDRSARQNKVEAVTINAGPIPEAHVVAFDRHYTGLDRQRTYKGGKTLAAPRTDCDTVSEIVSTPGLR